MNDVDKLKNIFVFLTILFGEKNFINEIMDMHPDYIVEKFHRYVESNKVEHSWGLSPSLRNSTFNIYLNKWGIDSNQYNE